MSYFVLGLKLMLAALWLFMLLAAVTDCRRSRNEHKVNWLILLVLLPFLGPIIYFQFAQRRFVEEV